MYVPPHDRDGGWRRPGSERHQAGIASIDKERLDTAFELMRSETKNGGLFVLRHGWLIYERWFGLGHPEATPNLASCGKPFTSIAMGMLINERPDRFPNGLDEKVYTPEFLPPEAFPPADPRKAEIKLGQLLSFTAGIRGNNPSFVHGQAVEIDPAGPDGWPAMTDEIALGLEDGKTGDVPYTTSTLWCAPGDGYSYATASIHLVSIVLRRIAGMELERYLDLRLGKQLGWGRWSVGYKNTRAGAHTSGGGGIALRASDMLRFGYLLLHEGRWGERQLVPQEYVRHATRKSPYNPHASYSLQFDVNTDGIWPNVPRDAFWKGGSGGHALYVVPSLDLVVWKLGGRDEQYQPSNTGLPLPTAPGYPLDRPGWHSTVDSQLALRRVLELAVEACR